MGLSFEDPATQQGQGDGYQGSLAGRQEHSQTPGRSVHNATVPRLSQLGQQPGQIGALPLASLQQNQCRDMARATEALLSLHVATHPRSDQTAGGRTLGLGETGGASSGLSAVRILLNKVNVCYANSFLICLAWPTLLTNSLDVCWWPCGGFELMRNVAECTYLPLDLVCFEPFRCLLGMEWTADDLLTQQDVDETGHLEILEVYSSYMFVSSNLSLVVFRMRC